MNFRPSREQRDLQEGIRAFCEARVSIDALRAMEQTGGFDRGLWGELADLGVFQLRAAESAGGLGLGVADAVLVFEELGRRLVPGPLVWSALAGDLVEGAAEGRAVVGGLDLMEGDPAALLVEHPESIDALLVLRPDGVRRVDPRELHAEPALRPLDPLTPVAHVTALPLGEAISGSEQQIAGPERARALQREGMTLMAAQLLGSAEATLAIALDYAKEREQFGRSIGSFQAIKHLLADMFARQELARASVYAAGATLDHPEVGGVEEAVRGALLVAGEAALKNARTCIQIHGGMGYTWEAPDHYHLKRCRVWESTFSGGEFQAERLATLFAESVDRTRAAGGESIHAP